MFTCHLTGMYSALQRLQGSLIVTHIEEVVVKLMQDIEGKALSRKADDKKGIPDLVCSNLVYLIRIGQVATHEDLPPIWKYLKVALKPQHLTTLHRAIDNTAHHLSVRAHIFATPGLLKLTLVVDFLLYHKDDLGAGLHQFGMCQHTSTAPKVLKVRVNQHHVLHTCAS